MRRLSLLLGLFLVWGCQSTDSPPQAGGEDFPNTINVLGRNLALGLDSTKTWNGLDSASVSTDLDNGLSDTGKRLQVATRSLAGSCVDTSYSGLLSVSRATAYFVKNACAKLGDGYVRDTLAFAGFFLGMKDTDIDTILWEQTDSVKPVVGYSARSILKDASGRGWFLAKSDTGRVSFSTQRKLGVWTELSELVSGGGADRKFATGSDNEMWSGTRTVLKGSDTTSWLSIVPAHPGIPVVGGPGDSGEALASKLTVDGIWSKREGGVLVVFRDSLQNYARRWNSLVIWSTGGFHAESATGPRADSTFRPRDTILLLERTQILGDSLHQEVRALLGPDPRKHDRDSLLSVRLERHRALGVERHTVWELVPDRPVASGQEAPSGSVTARVDFSDGTFIAFQGRWQGTAFAGTWKTQNGSGQVNFGRQGNVQ